MQLCQYYICFILDKTVRSVETRCVICGKHHISSRKNKLAGGKTQIWAELNLKCTMKDSNIVPCMVEEFVYNSWRDEKEKKKINLNKLKCMVEKFLKNSRRDASDKKFKFR